ncbi:transcription regulator complex subunit bur6 [Coccinella septempunctata]|uniref:transcription regulator complex subunit bur6 n=1 Tax=Coccinella septempunctata TaxID=41139 RepID=UPI001D060F32|nr:transcription regulator complex subunit bur6 [Coccinella septempunctata]
MPSKKRKYNARFPAGRIKKIMQTDEEVGKVAQAVPIIISRTLELFVESLLMKSTQITLSRNAKTLTPSHMKQCILAESRFDFLKDLVKNIPDASAQEDNENNLLFDASLENPESTSVSAIAPYSRQISQVDENKKSNTVIRYGPCMPHDSAATSSSTVTRRKSITQSNSRDSNNISREENSNSTQSAEDDTKSDDISSDDEKPAKILKLVSEDVPPLIPILSHSKNDVLVIDEDYDN